MFYAGKVNSIMKKKRVHIGHEREDFGRLLKGKEGQAGIYRAQHPDSEFCVAVWINSQQYGVNTCPN